MSSQSFLALYDKDYINGGCVGVPPVGTGNDDTFGTYASNYLIAFVGCLTAIALVFNTRPAPWYKGLGLNWNLWTAFGYGLAGVLHQVLREDEEHAKHQYIWKTSYISTLLGIFALNILGNQVILAKGSMNSTCHTVITVISILAFAVVAGLNAFTQASLVLTGAYSGLVLLYVLLVFASQCDFVKAIGVSMMITGMVVQVVLAPQCGDAGYPDCFKDCPLPAPDFNHNALFHVLFAIGLAVLGASMNTNPSVASEFKPLLQA